MVFCAGRHTQLFCEKELSTLQLLFHKYGCFRYPIIGPQNNIDASINDLGFTQTFTLGIYETLSSGAHSQTAAVEAETQDQVYYLLMGLTLLNKLVDANAVDGSNTFGHGSSGTLLAEQASKIAETIINHIKSDPLWLIKDPITGKNCLMGWNTKGNLTF